MGILVSLWTAYLEKVRYVVQNDPVLEKPSPNLPQHNEAMQEVLDEMVVVYTNSPQGRAEFLKFAETFEKK